MILNDSVTEWLYNQPDCSMKTAYYDIKTWKKCLDIRGEVWGKKYQQGRKRTRKKPKGETKEGKIPRRIFTIISNWQEKNKPKQKQKRQWKNQKKGKAIAKEKLM